MYAETEQFSNSMVTVPFDAHQSETRRLTNDFFGRLRPSWGRELQSTVAAAMPAPARVCPVDAAVGESPDAFTLRSLSNVDGDYKLVAGRVHNQWLKTAEIASVVNIYTIQVRPTPESVVYMKASRLPRESRSVAVSAPTDMTLPLLARSPVWSRTCSTNTWAAWVMFGNSFMVPHPTAHATSSPIHR